MAGKDLLKAKKTKPDEFPPSQLQEILRQDHRRANGGFRYPEPYMVMRIWLFEANEEEELSRSFSKSEATGTKDIETDSWEEFRSMYLAAIIDPRVMIIELESVQVSTIYAEMIRTQRAALWNCTYEIEKGEKNTPKNPEKGQSE